MIIDQSECLICYFLCTELTLFCTELSENCIYLNQSELSNFFLYVIGSHTHSLYFCVLVNSYYNIASKAAQSNSVYVRVLKIPIVHADSVSKSLRQKFFFSRERPLLARGKIIYLHFFRTLQTSHVLHNSIVHAKA